MSSGLEKTKDKDKVLPVVEKDGDILVPRPWVRSKSFQFLRDIGQDYSTPKVTISWPHLHFFKKR